MCAILPIEGENSSYVRLKFHNQLKRRALIDTGSCANAQPQCFFLELEKSIPDQIILEEPSFHSVRMAAGQRVTIGKQAKITKTISKWTAYLPR